MFVFFDHFDLHSVDQNVSCIRTLLLCAQKRDTQLSYVNINACFFFICALLWAETGSQQHSLTEQLIPSWPSSTLTTSDCGVILALVLFGASVKHIKGESSVWHFHSVVWAAHVTCSIAMNTQDKVSVLKTLSVTLFCVLMYNRWKWQHFLW